jgi:hypothetical protein
MLQQVEDFVMNARPGVERTCAHCKAKASVSQLYCSRCGYLLPDVQIIDETAKTSRLGTAGAGIKTAPLQQGTGYFHPQARLFLQAVGGKIVPIMLTPGVPIVIGRNFDTTDPTQVDLAELGAKEFGVSRRHLQLELRDNAIYAADMGSTNGTYINRERLLPGQPTLVRNRAAIQMGVLIMRALFM